MEDILILKIWHHRISAISVPIAPSIFACFDSYNDFSTYRMNGFKRLEVR